MKRDQYQFRQGRDFAADVLRCAASALAEAHLLAGLLENLRKTCANKPPSFAEGDHVIRSRCGCVAMTKFCEICAWATDGNDAFCPDCRGSLRHLGVSDNYIPKPSSKNPPPTTEYRNMGPTPYRLGMLLMVAAVFSAGLITGFLVRGGL